MTDRRRFIAACGASVAVLATPMALRASTTDPNAGPRVSVDTFRPLVGQRFRCMTDLGYAVRLRLLEVLDGPAVTGIDQFTLLLKERGRSGPSTLAEGGYTVYHKAIGNYPFFLMPAHNRPRHYITSFAMLY